MTDKERIAELSQALDLQQTLTTGLHALIFGEQGINDPDYALKCIQDGGSIHEYVHTMMRAQVKVY